MSAKSGRAVILGGGIAGLIAARVLAGRFAHVTLVERHRLAHDGAVRDAAPQGAHAHAMLARGLQIIERLFPGYTDELVAGGASLVGVQDVRVYVLGWRQGHDSPLRVLAATRPFMEWMLARRVRALDNVDIVENAEAVAAQGSRSRITGVTLRTGETTRDLAADLIVDARGRRSNLADWMKALGAETPPHETSPLASVYCSYLLEPAPGHPRPLTHQVAKFEDKLGVLIFPVESGRVLLSVGANAKVPLPKTHAEMLTFLKDRLPVPDAYDAIKNLRPITPIAYSRFSASVRRNFDALAHPPEGIVAIGDAVASFNPIFGQGMTIAALEAEWLETCLAKSDPSTDGFAKAYYAGVKPIVDLAWGFPDLEAKRNDPKAQPAGIRFLLWYTERMNAVATRSQIVSKTIAHVQNMVEPPAALFRPSIFLRVLLA
ncbi:MAG: FAD-dependent monooxygenase [Alphaproteobacteria bacterium]|nr:FAD-dependent monooxygenase [Alphaproteobacteria bacterium]